jgi:alpha-L-fucosidase 2
MLIVVLFATVIQAVASAEVKTDIEYGKAGDESLLLDVEVPDAEGVFPTLIIIHGGGWGGGDKQQDIVPAIGANLKGKFTSFSINYRLAPKNRWPACYDDVRRAIRWVKAHAREYKADPDRVALIGYSAGGQLAFLAAMSGEEDIKVQAVVGIAPPTDFEQDLPQRGGLSESLQKLLDRPKEVTDDSRKQLREMSPINHIKPGLPPFLIIQGDVDKTVPIQQSLNTQAKLKEAGVSCELITIKDAPHRLAQWKQFDASYPDTIANWLSEHLKKP